MLIIATHGMILPPSTPSHISSPPCAKVVFSKAVTVSPSFLTAGPKVRVVFWSGFFGGRSLQKIRVQYYGSGGI